MSEPGQPPIHSPHDRFFKENFGRLEVARAFFAHYVPAGLGSNADWSSLQPHPAHFVDERLMLQSSDLLVDLHGLPLEESQENLVLYLVLTLMQAVREGESARRLKRKGPLLAKLLRQGDRAGLLRTLLVYLTRADTRMTPSTFREAAARLAQQEVRGDVMTLAEALIEEGRQEGWQKGQQEGWQKGLERGAMIGRIQLCQGLLGVAATTAEELRQWETSRLRAELSALETQLHDRLETAAAGAARGH